MDMKFETVKELIVWLCGVEDVSEAWWMDEISHVYVIFDDAMISIYEKINESEIEPASDASDVIYGTFSDHRHCLELSCKNYWVVNIETVEELKLNTFYKIKTEDLIPTYNSRNKESECNIVEL